MHPDPQVAHEVRMELIHRHVVHAGATLLQLDLLDLKLCAIRLRQLVSDLEIFDVRPSFSFDPERMVIRRFDLLAPHMDRVDFVRDVIEGRRNGLVAFFSGHVVFGQHLIADLDIFDVFIALVGLYLRPGRKAVTVGKLCFLCLTSRSTRPHRRYFPSSGTSRYAYQTESHSRPFRLRSRRDPLPITIDP